MQELQAAVDKVGRDTQAMRERRDEHSREIADLRSQVRALETSAARLDLETGGRPRGKGMTVAEREAFGTFLSGGDASRFYNAMGINPDTKGGFFVPEQMHQTILELAPPSSPLWELATVVPMTTGESLTIPLLDARGAVYSWISEQAARPETTDPDAGSLRIPGHEGYSNILVTQAMIEASPYPITEIVLRVIGQRRDAATAAAFVSGNGVSRPRGFTTYPTSTAGDATRPWGTVQHVVSGHASAFITPTATANPADALIDLKATLAPAYRPNAAWAMNRTTFATVSKFRDPDGRYVVTPSLAQGEPDQLLGHPVRLFDDLPDVGANALPVWFGDWRAAFWILSWPTYMLLDPYTAKPYLSIYSRQRVGGALVNTEAVKALKIST